MGIYTVDEMQDAGVIPATAVRSSVTLESLTDPKLTDPVPETPTTPAQAADEPVSDATAD